MKKSGFTLVELMVSLTIFSIVMLISTSTLLIMIDANAKAQALYSATSNLSFALDSITREMRMGYEYYCTELEEWGLYDEVNTEVFDCLAGNYIAFTREWDNQRIAYRFFDDNGMGRIEINKGDGWLPITSDDIDIDSFEVTIQNTDTYKKSSDRNQPYADLLIRGKTSNGLEQETEFNIQSHIVQRRLDLR